jgi:hypothetical protein
VTPTAHFQMGGMRIDAECRTTIPASTPRARTRAACTAPTASAATASPSPSSSAPSPAPPWSRHLGPKKGCRSQFLRGSRPARGEVNPFKLRKCWGGGVGPLGIIRSREELALAGSRPSSASEDALGAVGHPEQTRAGNAALQERLNSENLVAWRPHDRRRRGHARGEPRQPLSRGLPRDVAPRASTTPPQSVPPTGPSPPSADR